MTSSLKTTAKSALIQALHRSRLTRVFANRHPESCAILALHRVRPYHKAAFEPNRSLEITPEFLDQTIRQVMDLGFEIVSLDEAYRRLKEDSGNRRFVSFTLDDGYADNYQHAAPVFDAYRAPFTIYATTGFLDGTAHFWWMLLEDVIRRETEVTLWFDGLAEHRKTGTTDEKYQAFDEFHQLFRALPAAACLAAANRLCADYQLDPGALSADHAMTWDMARRLTEKGLGSIEAHTVSHLALSRQEPEAIRAEMDQSTARIEAQTGRRPRHFAYPFGDPGAADEREYGIMEALPFLTATTTRTGMLTPGRGARYSALPRVTLNGLYQSSAYVDVVLSGFAGSISRSLQRVKSGLGTLKDGHQAQSRVANREQA